MVQTQLDSFADALVSGQAPHEAYVKLFGCKAHETVDSPTLKQRAKALAQDSYVVQRVSEGRRPVVAQAQAAFAFTLDKALRGAQRAHDLAELTVDPSVMLKAIELQAKLKKLLGSDGARAPGVLDSTSTDDLLSLLHELKRRREAEVIDVQGTLSSEGVSASPALGTGPASGEWRDLV